MATNDDAEQAGSKNANCNTVPSEEKADKPADRRRSR